MRKASVTVCWDNLSKKKLAYPSLFITTLCISLIMSTFLVASWNNEKKNRGQIALSGWSKNSLPGTVHQMYMASTVMGKVNRNKILCKSYFSVVPCSCMAPYPALMGLKTHLWYSLVRKLKNKGNKRHSKKYSCLQLIKTFTLRVTYRDLYLGPKVRFYERKDHL